MKTKKPVQTLEFYHFVSFLWRTCILNPWIVCILYIWWSRNILVRVWALWTKLSRIIKFERMNFDFVNLNFMVEWTCDGEWINLLNFFEFIKFLVVIWSNDSLLDWISVPWTHRDAMSFFLENFIMIWFVGMLDHKGLRYIIPILDFKYKFEFILENFQDFSNSHLDCSDMSMLRWESENLN